MAVEKRLDELATIAGGTVAGDGAVAIRDVASIDEAGSGDITFISDAKYLKLLKTTRASAVIVREPDPSAGVSQLVTPNPLLAFAVIIDVFRPLLHPAPGIHPRAEVHKDAIIGKDASIQAFTVVEEGARIGERAILYPGVYVGRSAAIGDDSILYPGVAIREGCVAGSRVIIHSNSVVGSDGFGYARAGGKYRKIPQRGIVIIEDDVEIGACVTVDRATVGTTVIGRGTKIDNLVQIAHNVKIGGDTVVAAQSGFAGSARVGSRVQFGGQAGVNGHIEIGSDSMIGAKTGVVSDLPERSVVTGFPAIPHREWLKCQALVAKLPELNKRIAELEKIIRELEDKE